MVSAHSCQPASEEVVFLGVDHSQNFTALSFAKAFKYNIVDFSGSSFAHIDEDIDLVCFGIGDDGVLKLGFEVAFFDIKFFYFIKSFIECLTVKRSFWFNAEFFL